MWLLLTFHKLCSWNRISLRSTLCNAEKGVNKKSRQNTKSVCLCMFYFRFACVCITRFVTQKILWAAIWELILSLFFRSYIYNLLAYSFLSWIRYFAPPLNDVLHPLHIKRPKSKNGYNIFIALKFVIFGIMVFAVRWRLIKEGCLVALWLMFYFSVRFEVFLVLFLVRRGWWN